eukprot:TRINITY_DN71204_c0_g1_i1.p1 TRINITY_DN71204_c0_g1~~TRINITY_DN71204_c0_g1_i1.p1  ORF type:complete len:259 (+),score=47.67 TRINITY_DN71204_c0_g1_i1:107-778(+)
MGYDQVYERKPVPRARDPVKEGLDLQRTIRTEMDLFWPMYKKMTEEQRLKALEGLNPAIRPRPLLGLHGSRSASQLVPVANMASAGKLQLTGLKGRAELNGSSCDLVDSIPDADGRVLVRLRGGGAEAKEMRVKAGKLCTASDGTQLAFTGHATTTAHNAGGRLFRVAGSAGGDATQVGLSSTGEAFRCQPILRERRGFARGQGGRFYSSSLSFETDPRLVHF